MTTPEAPHTRVVISADISPYIRAMAQAGDATRKLADNVTKAAAVEQAAIDKLTAAQARLAKARAEAARVAGLPAGPRRGAGGQFLPDGQKAAAADLAAAEADAVKVGKARERAATATARAVGRAAADEIRINERRMDAYRKVGTTVAATSAVIVAGLLLSAKAAIDWEASFAGVRKVFAGDNDLGGLEKQLRGLATTLPSSQTEIAKLAAAAGQLGVAKGNIAAFVRTAVELGATTTLSAEDAITGLAKLNNIMGGSQTQIARTGAVLLALGNQGAGTEADILALAERLAGAGKAAGLTQTQILGISNAMASLGIDAELGGGALSRVVLRMTSDVATGGKQLDAFARLAGQSSVAFSAAFKKDPGAAFQSVIAGLARVRAEGGNVVAAMTSIGAAGVRDRDVLNRLTGGIDQLNDSFKVAAEAWRKPLALLEASEQRFGTTAAKIQLARNQVRDLGIDLGGALLPKIGGAADSVRGFAKDVQGLPGPLRDAVTTLGGSAAAAGLLGGAFLLLLPRINAAKKAMAESKLSAGALGKGFLVATAVLAGAQFASSEIDKWTKSIDEATGRVANIVQLRRSLLDFAETGKATGEFARLFGRNLQGLGKDYANVLHETTREKIGQDIFDHKGLRTFADGLNDLDYKLTGNRNSFEESKKKVQALDKAMADLVTAGVPVDSVMKDVQAAFNASGGSVEDFIKTNPKLVASLQGVALAEKQEQAAAEKNAAAHESMAERIAAGVLDLTKVDNAIKDIKSEYKDTTAGLDKANADMADGYVELADKARDAADGISAVGDAVKSSVDKAFTKGEAFDKFMSDLDKAGKKGKDAQAQADAIAKAIPGLTSDQRTNLANNYIRPTVGKQGGRPQSLSGNSPDAIDARDQARQIIKDWTAWFVTQIPKDATKEQVQQQLGQQAPQLQAALGQKFSGPELGSLLAPLGSIPDTYAQHKAKADADQQVQFDKLGENALNDLQRFAHANPDATGEVVSGETQKQIDTLTQALRAGSASEGDINKRVQPLQDFKDSLPNLVEDGKTAIELAAKTNDLLAQILNALPGDKGNIYARAAGHPGTRYDPNIFDRNVVPANDDDMRGTFGQGTSGGATYIDQNATSAGRDVPSGPGTLRPGTYDGVDYVDQDLKRLRGKRYAAGGYTGDGDPLEPAGIVHRREYVVRAGPAAANRASLEAMNRGAVLAPGGGGGAILGARGYTPGARAFDNYHAAPGHMWQGGGGTDWSRVATIVTSAVREALQGVNINVHPGDVHMDSRKVGTLQGGMADLAGRSTFGGTP